MRDDIRYALRSIGRTPGLSTVVVITLSLSIALVTTFYGFINGVFYHPLPYPAAEQVVSLGHLGNTRALISELAATTRTLEDLTTFDEHSSVLLIGSEPVEISAVSVDTAFFRTLRVKPLLGATPSIHDFVTGAPVVVIGGRAWKTRFGSRRDIVGQFLTIDGTTRQVIGVMPDWFTFPTNSEAWVPFTEMNRSPNEQIQAIARVRLDANRGLIGQELSLVTARVRAEATPDLKRRLRFGSFDLSQDMVYRGDRFGGNRLMWMVLGGALCVLLVACTNVASLMLARAARRRSEMAIRASLGASPRRLIFQQLMEGTILGTMSGAVGSLIAFWTLRAAPMIFPEAITQLPGWIFLGLDWRVALFVTAVSFITVFIFSLWPAVEAIGFETAGALRERATIGIFTTDSSRKLHLPVVLQVGLSLTLLAIAAVLLRSARAYRTEQGLNLDGLSAVRFALRVSDSMPSQYTAVHKQILARMQELPGPFQAASIAKYDGIGDSATFSDFELRVADDNRFLPDGTEHPGIRLVSENYFQVMGIKFVSGRPFNENERRGPPTAVVVSRKFAQDVWGTASVTGQSLLLGKSLRLKVVGVTESVKELGLSAGRLGFVEGRDVFLSQQQAVTCCNSLSYVVRSPLPVDRVADWATSAAASLGYTLPAKAVAYGDLGGEAQRNRLMGRLLATFALLGIVLASLGVYGVVSFAVHERRQEIGIRLVLGAEGSAAVRLLMWSGLRLVLIGCAVGLLSAIFFGRLLQVYIITSLVQSGLAAIGVAAGFVLLAAVACYTPARKALKIQPAQLLRRT